MGMPQYSKAQKVKMALLLDSGMTLWDTSILFSVQWASVIAQQENSAHRQF